MASILSSLRGSLCLGRASLVELIALACNEQVASKLARILWFSSERDFVEAVESFAVASIQFMVRRLEFVAVDGSTAGSGDAIGLLGI